MSKFNIKPGDLIRWKYFYVTKYVRADETLWSTIEHRLVPIGSNLVHMCTFFNNMTISWLNEEGLFTARLIDGCVDKDATKNIPVRRVVVKVL